MTQRSHHAETTTPTATPSPTALNFELRAETTAAPELCGFVQRTASLACATGYTCKFNTDINAVGCCKDDVCDWRTVCCHARPAAITVATWPPCGGTAADLVAVCGYVSLSPSPSPSPACLLHRS